MAARLWLREHPARARRGARDQRPFDRPQPL